LEKKKGSPGFLEARGSKAPSPITDGADPPVLYKSPPQNIRHISKLQPTSKQVAHQRFTSPIPGGGDRKFATSPTRRSTSDDELQGRIHPPPPRRLPSIHRSGGLTGGGLEAIARRREQQRCPGSHVTPDVHVLPRRRLGGEGRGSQGLQGGRGQEGGGDQQLLGDRAKQQAGAGRRHRVEVDLL